MDVSEILVKLLEKYGVKYIFGHPGEQILPFYKALMNSSITHILTRHEQVAAHSADTYSRSSGNFGVCISTAGPGAMNLVMGVATAFRDSVPMLVITGDNDLSQNGDYDFQSCPINDIFSNITVKSFYPKSGGEAISNLVESLEILNKFPKGPVHINFSKNILSEDCNPSILGGNFIFRNNFDNLLSNQSDDMYDVFDIVANKLQDAKKPLIITGNGIVWSKSIDKLKAFVSKSHIPIATTFSTKGIIDEEDKFNLGLVGLRGTSIANYAYRNADLILALGTRLSDRTIAADNFSNSKNKIIQVNIDKNSLKSNINICEDVSKFLDFLLSLNLIYDDSWLDEIYSHYQTLFIEGIEDKESNYNPLKPQYAINKILSSFKSSYILSDAGTHTTWTLLLSSTDRFGKLLFSGAFAPMGFGLGGSIGVAIAHPNDKVVVICGDGDIQMVIQELATIQEYDLNISIFIINNSQLGIIRQWQQSIYNFDHNYQVDLKNPNFKQIANAYHIDSMEVISKEDLELAIKNASKEGPYLVDIHVTQEDIPLPK